jgi:hypothetical protein
MDHCDQVFYRYEQKAPADDDAQSTQVRGRAPTPCGHDGLDVQFAPVQRRLRSSLESCVNVLLTIRRIVLVFLLK